MERRWTSQDTREDFQASCRSVQWLRSGTLRSANSSRGRVNQRNVPSRWCFRCSWRKHLWRRTRVSSYIAERSNVVLWTRQLQMSKGAVSIQVCTMRRFSSYRKLRLQYDESLRQGARCPVDIGFAPTEVKRRVRTSRRWSICFAYRARRKNVPRHILLLHIFICGCIMSDECGLWAVLPQTVITRIKIRTIRSHKGETSWVK